MTPLLLLLLSIPEREPSGLPHLRSESVLLRFADTGQVALEKNADQQRPIASVTKLLSALLLEPQPLDLQWIEIQEDDKDRLKWSRSRLKVGQRWSPNDLFAAALIASENRAVYALVRATGAPRSDFVARMNQHAQALGMRHSQFYDPAGVDPRNVSTARDLTLLLQAAAQNQRVRETTQQRERTLFDPEARALRLISTNRLARSERWSLVVGKTGYTVEAGRALAVRVILEGRPVDMVFLGAREMASVFGDAGRASRWLLEQIRKGRFSSNGPA